jgi:hypothetical protein
MTAFIGTSLQLQPIITAHNQWLFKTRSIPYWTTSVFSSTVTDLVLIYESVTSSASVVLWLTFHRWTLNSLTNESLKSLTNAERRPTRQSSLSLMVRPTVSRSVGQSVLELKHLSGAYDQIFITVRQLRVCWFGALSLTRGRLCRSQLLLVLASDSQDLLWCSEAML